MAGKSQQKTEIQVAAEKAEMTELSASILRMTTNIPDRVINGASAQLVRQYRRPIRRCE